MRDGKLIFFKRRGSKSLFFLKRVKRGWFTLDGAPVVPPCGFDDSFNIDQAQSNGLTPTPTPTQPTEDNDACSTTGTSDGPRKRKNKSDPATDEEVLKCENALDEGRSLIKVSTCSARSRFRQ